MRARAIAIVGLIIASMGLAGPAGARGPTAAQWAVYGLAHRCYALRAPDGRFLSAAARGYAASAAPRTPFRFQATGLGTFLLYDPRGEMVAARGARVAAIAQPGPAGEFAVTEVRRGRFTLRSTAERRWLAVSAPGAPRLRRSAQAFALSPRRGCAVFPEAQLGATVIGPSRTLRDGAIFGYIDDHVHVTANQRSGGDVISGEPFDRFGITAALGRDVAVHGVDGKLDVIGDLLRNGAPVGSHDTHGWPTFAGWPTYNTQTHQQAYWVWIERAWRAGMRMLVAQTADDGPMCRIAPRRATPTCAETPAIVDQIATLKQMQDYIDAQAGGPGKGFFRLVYTPGQASRVMRAGKLAVVIAIESSDLLGCSERHGHAACTRADIDRGLARYTRLGVRDMFIAHWTNNAFAGAAFEGGAKGVFINIMNRFATGTYFATAPCPGPGQGVVVKTISPSLLKALSAFFPAAKPIANQPMPPYPPTPRCNARGLTALGRYLVARMMADHLLIEVDHLSESARDEVLAMAARARYPLISSHNGTGGEWTPSELDRLYRLGGFAAATPDQAPALAQKILALARHDHRGLVGVGLGSDTGGFASLPGPRADAAAHPLRYPFTSYDGSVRFTRERTGTRGFDLNTDGVAQYGLFADLLADMSSSAQGRRTLALLFNSAQVYDDTWLRAWRHR